MISELNVDKSFIAANGVDLKKWLSTPNPDMALFKGKLTEIGNQVILIVDSSKLGKVSFVKFFDFDKVDVMITDDKISSEMLKQIEKTDVETIIAK